MFSLISMAQKDTVNRIKHQNSQKNTISHCNLNFTVMCSNLLGHDSIFHNLTLYKLKSGPLKLAC